MSTHEAITAGMLIAFGILLTFYFARWLIGVEIRLRSIERKMEDAK